VVMHAVEIVRIRRLALSMQGDRTVCRIRSYLLCANHSKCIDFRVVAAEYPCHAEV
jgi:hypothetical protein